MRRSPDLSARVTSNHDVYTSERNGITIVTRSCDLCISSYEEKKWRCQANNFITRILLEVGE